MAQGTVRTDPPPTCREQIGIDLIEYLVNGGRSGRSIRADLRACASRLLERHQWMD
jgi:hypothetical protein